MSGTASDLERIRSEITADPDNAWAAAANYQPIYVADAAARIAIVGQAPGRKAQESGIPWNDASGARLIDWLGVDETTFRDASRFALLPMDFYYPGKGSHGDLPPRRGFAARWHPRILQAMPHIQLTLLIGSYAQRHYLGTRESLTATVRRFPDYLPAVLPLVHPSPLNFRWLAKNPWYEAEVLPQLRQCVRAALA
ncbi:uracil-DNA glycosylase [Planotetraspora silvatica]|uniref:Uracil-DNA glycosylase n=1 Tax=Planotetraspora silvatica TaxID=234614 RepID=A0A8J3UU02_9ACTN|nr:uracil-DNA glycosylase family protein [Planotetraspora silvatica]GII50680.1 uracil-DNA glycosylase [Planotetraspora silvatica]